MKKYFAIFLDNCTHKNIKPQKSRYWGFSSTLAPAHLFAMRGRRKRGFQFFKIVPVTSLGSAKWKEANGKPDEINELILKNESRTEGKTW